MYLVWRYIMFKAKYGIRWQQQCCCNTSMKFTWWTLWTRPLNDKSVPSSGGSLSPLPGRSKAITWIFRGRFCGKKISQYRISFKIIQHVLNPVYIFIKCIAGGIKQGNVGMRCFRLTLTRGAHIDLSAENPWRSIMLDLPFCFCPLSP